MWILFKFIGIIRCGASISRFIHSGSGCLWILRFLNDLMIYSILRAERSSINRHALLTIHPSRKVFHYFIWLDVLFARSTTWTTVAVRFSSSLIAHDLSTKHISCFISERPHHATEPHCQFWRSCAYYRMATTHPRMLSTHFNLS